MASWGELKAMVKERYNVEEVDAGFLRLVFAVGDQGRSQIVTLARFSNDNTGEEWVGISSPVGKIGEVSIELAARKAFEVLCGGIVVINDLICLHHSAPLVNLDMNEFLRPLSIIMNQADAIEAALSGGDRY